jgi:divalent anion:Na+ symporter, DASS family
MLRSHLLMIRRTTMTTLLSRPGGGTTPTSEPHRPTPAARVARQVWRFLLPAAVGVALWFTPAPDGVKPQAWHLLAIFVATIVAIVAKPLPMGAVAILGITATALTGVLEPAQALSGFSNSVIWLIVLAFFIARGFIKTGLGTRIAYQFVRLLGGRTLGLSYGLLATDLVMAPAIPSNTARAGGVIYPIAKSLSSSYGSEPDEGSRRRIGTFLTLTAFHGNVITSAMFVTAMAANPLAVQLAGAAGVHLSWGEWALAALLPGLVALLVVPLVVYKLQRPEVTRTPEAPQEARRKLAEMGPMSRAEKTMLATFALLLGLWTLGDQLWDLNATVAALVGIAVLLITKVLTWDDVLGERTAWDTLVWFAALVMMATFLNSLGLIKWFSGEMSDAVGGLAWQPAFIALALIYFVSHYFFASNTAHVSAMYAAFLATAIALGTPAVLAALVFGFLSSLFGGLTHYGSGPAPVLYGSGYVPLGTWWRIGALVGAVNLVIWIVVGGAWMRLIGVW